MTDTLIKRLRDGTYYGVAALMKEAADALEQQAAEIAALRADAERLDFLQDHKVTAYPVFTVTRHWKTDGTNDMEERSTFDGWQCAINDKSLPTIRAAIDAFLRREQPAGEGEK